MINKIKKCKINIIKLFIFIAIIFLGKNVIYAKSQYVEGINAFPESYQTYLQNLHSIHPNWKFVAVYTDLDWQNTVDNETVDRRSLVKRVKKI